MSITTETRDESFAQIDKKKRKEEVLAVFGKGEKLTAREVLRRLKPGSDNMNYVRPRITELCAGGFLEETDRVHDDYTNRYVTAWQRTADVQTELGV